MTYKIQDNSARVVSERSNKTILAMRFGLDGIHKEANQNTPKKYGLLRNDVTKTVTGKIGKIVWGRKYAAAQEAGTITIKKDGGAVPPGTYVFRKYTTPGTGAHFAENAAEKEGGNPDKYFKMAGL